MPKFKIYELQNLNSVRQGETIEVKDLTQAKRYASKNQVFHGTVLKICNEYDITLSVKDTGFANRNTWADEL